MQKPKISERRPTWVLASLLNLGLALPLAALAQDDRDMSRITMEQSIEAARKKKSEELAATLRDQLQISAPTAAAPHAPAAPLPQTPPQLWSLTSQGTRVWAEVLLDGRIVALDSTLAATTLGAWTVLSLTPDALTLTRNVDTARTPRSRRDKAVTLILHPPVPGTLASTYRFTAAPDGADLDLLPESAQRAAQLPFNPSSPSRQ